MTCDEAREAFSDLYDNTLSGPPLAALTRHLETCPACGMEWAAFQRAVQAVAALGGAEPSPGFAARVRQQVEASPWWRRVVQWLFLPLRVKAPLQALALVLVAFAGLLIYQR
ncbi:MAG: zf-HC2 domain-containing protein, partial [Candidatus Methylomirabilales bacterium]